MIFLLFVNLKEIRVIYHKALTASWLSKLDYRCTYDSAVGRLSFFDQKKKKKNTKHLNFRLNWQKISREKTKYLGIPSYAVVCHQSVAVLKNRLIIRNRLPCAIFDSILRNVSILTGTTQKSRKFYKTNQDRDKNFSWK